jgi:glycosyltransferase involved in cell wall biosynthesis
MRVTMLVRCLAMMRGGGETRHLAWARELGDLGADVDIVAGRPLIFGGPRYPTDPEVPVTLLRSPYTRDFVYRHQHRRGFGRLTMMALHADEEWFCRAAWRYIADRRPAPDVVHAHALHQAARLGAAGVPVVINLPGAPHPRYTADLRRADALVADGWAAANLPETLGRDVDRVPKGVDSERFRPDGPSVRETLRLAERRVVLTVARLVPLKNIPLLVDAVAIVREHVPTVHLVIVGDGPEREKIAVRVAERDLGDCVTFAGSIAHRDTPAFYRAADLFALSSQFDNSPNALLEAMASGLPVVCTDVGGVREFVADPAGGTVVPPGDAAALAAGIERYLSGDRAGTAGAHNRAVAVAEYSWRVSAERLLAVYQRVLDARSAGFHAAPAAPAESRASA